VLIGYNLLGAYARARALAGAPIGIVQPEDYTLVMSRAALIPRLARQPDLGGMFIDYLVSTRGQETIARRALLYPLNALAYKAIEATGQGQLLAGPLRPLALGPALLVFLDPMKRARFIASWQQVVLQP
jgi:two-component system sensor histidine kinase TctE